MPKKKTPKSLPLLPNDVEDMIIGYSFPRIGQTLRMKINTGDTREAVQWSKTNVKGSISDLHGNDDYLKHKMVRLKKRGLSKPFDLRVDIIDPTEDTEHFMDKDVPVNSAKVVFTALAQSKKKKKSKKAKRAKRSKKKRSKKARSKKAKRSRSKKLKSKRRKSRKY